MAEANPPVTPVTVFNAMELLLNISQRYAKSLERFCYFVLAVLVLETAGFLALVHHCRHVS